MGESERVEETQEIEEMGFVDRDSAVRSFLRPR